MAKTARFTFLHGIEPETTLAILLDRVDTCNTNMNGRALLQFDVDGGRVCFLNVFCLRVLSLYWDERDDTLRTRRRCLCHVHAVQRAVSYSSFQQFKRQLDSTGLARPRVMAYSATPPANHRTSMPFLDD